MNARGLLQHHFHGDYSASIVLRFASADCAQGALEVLREFRQSTAPDAIIATLNSDALDKFKDRWRERITITPCGHKHCSHQCRNSEIDNVNHSVDYGADFTVDVPAVPANQMRLVLGAESEAR